MNLFKGCPGSKILKEVRPFEIRCPCGNTVEIWSDEVSAICEKCHRKLTRKIMPSCLDWCPVAKECVGEVKYKKYLEQKRKEE
jgi:hypothetical protein